jgi:D-alanyl-D-alanine carboxypeptidase/D-alanyl-D-alanine-endopeptidase (penicillin-binding protein 4)
MLFSPGLSYGGEQRAVPLEGRLNVLLPRDAQWALEVIDMDTGSTVISMGNARDKRLVPGSLMKLVIAGAALDRVSKRGNIDMTTTIFHDGAISGNAVQGNIYLVGRGNALLSERDLERAVGTIARRGVKKITGDIIADDTAFDARGLERSRNGTGYAPPAALGMDLHTAVMYVLPTKAGHPPEIRSEPRNDEVRVAVSALTVSGAPNSIMITQIDDALYAVAGNIPEGSGAVKKRFSLKDPALYAAGTLRTLLKRAGISVSGQALKGKAPKKAMMLAEIKSPELGSLLRDMNVNSLNVIADNLLLLLGGVTYGFPGTRDKGILAKKEFLAKLGFSSEEYSMSDGSGLSDGDRVSTNLLTRYLQKASKQPWFRTFEESLPRAGMEGTIKNIGFADPRFRAKTGKVENAFGLAGYGTDKTGRRLAFSFIVNVNAADVMGLEKSGAEIMRYLATEGAL